MRWPDPQSDPDKWAVSAVSGDADHRDKISGLILPNTKFNAVTYMYIYILQSNKDMKITTVISYKLNVDYYGFHPSPTQDIHALRKLNVVPGIQRTFALLQAALPYASVF